MTKPDIIFDIPPNNISLATLDAVARILQDATQIEIEQPGPNSEPLMLIVHSLVQQYHPIVSIYHGVISTKFFSLLAFQVQKYYRTVSELPPINSTDLIKSMQSALYESNLKSFFNEEAVLQTLWKKYICRQFDKITEKILEKDEQSSLVSVFEHLYYRITEDYPGLQS